MDFTEYLTYRAATLAARPDVLDAGETRIVHALGHLRTPVESLPVPEHAHRCHLAEFWLDHFGLDRSLKARTLISQGVRHSLGLLFWQYAAQGLRVAIPRDVYPAYDVIARAEGLQVMPYGTWPVSSLLTELFCRDDAEQLDVILITNPLKPRVRRMSSQGEVRLLKDWLKKDSRRRVVIDAVYQFSAPFDAPTLELLATNQVVLLHSLSKSWVRPLVMGVALVPDADVEMLTPAFRAEPPLQDNLRLAQGLLTGDGQFPVRLVGELVARREMLQERLEERGCLVRLSPEVPSYLFPARISHEELLADYNVLAIPASVFGSPLPNRSVLSSLAMPGAPAL